MAVERVTLLVFKHWGSMMYRFEQTAELVAHSADGCRYQIIEYTKFMNLADCHTAHRWEPVGPKEYWVEGQRVKMVSETEFAIPHPRRYQTTLIRVAAPT